MLASKKPGQTTDASLLVSGTLADARLSSNVALENAANVFTAKQSFSGTTHSGLCLHSLTTSEYNALTPANGDLFRDSTTDRIDARLNRGTVEMIDTAGGQTINGALAITGVLDLRKGAAANVLQFSNTAFLRTDTSQLSIFDTGIGRNNIALWRNGNFVVGSSTLIAASSGADATGNVVDTSFSRNAAGVWQMGTTAANASGSLLLTNLTASGTVRLGTFTVGTLPSASANTRARSFVTDSNLAFNSTNLGSTVTAGGSTLVPVFSNGTNWVIG